MQNVPLMAGGDGRYRADNSNLGVIAAKTAAYTIKNDDSAQVFSNKGAGGAITFTLPSPKAGERVTVLKTAAQNIVLQAPAGAKVGGSAVGKKYQNITAGDAGSGSVSLLADGTDWYVIGQVGTWAVDNT